MPDKGGFPHYMLKEIHEEPEALRATVEPRIAPSRDRIILPDVKISAAQFRALKRIKIVASGTSRHAGLAGKYRIEGLAELPVDVDHSSEFAYRRPLLERNELVIAITQSGETADTLAALREVKTRGALSVAICNVVQSTIAREADAALYTYAGPEISIASTKAFVAQLAVLYLLALYLAQICDKVKSDFVRHSIAALLALPEKISAVLKRETEVAGIADHFHTATDFLFLGRGVHYPVVLDGALKLKEVSYIHAEGYPTGEVKHGPQALIDETLPVVIVATRDPNDADSVLRYEKTLANLKDIRKRSGQVIAIANTGDDEIRRATEHAIFVPNAPELLLPMIEIVPLQLLAYYIAVRRGLDVDRPRNLSKAVLQE